MSGSLAGTIQGEAGSDPANQFAVAATIYNRQQAGTFPGGTDPNAIVNAKDQYVGSSGSPNSTAQEFASAIENGTLGNYGNVGNAVNFQSGQTAANNGLTDGGANIGGNYFSDRFGAPTSNFIAPSYTGGSVHPALSKLGIGGKATADSNSLNPTPSADQKDQMKSPASATSQDLFNGAPVYLTDPHGVASEAGKSVQEGAQKAGTDIKSGLTTTATSINDASAQAGGITQYIGNALYNTLPRIGLILMGIILIGGAFVIMGFEQARKTA